MAQVIIHTNSNGGVSVTMPTGELPIEQVQAKDTPEGSIIIDSSALPQGNDVIYFEAWELHGSNVSVNISKAKIIHTNEFNLIAAAAHQTRLSNTAIGLSNSTDDTTWSNNIVSMRNAIANTTTISELVAIGFPKP